jgi:hypothetical protein
LSCEVPASDLSEHNQQGLLLTESAGTWAVGVYAALPPGAASNPDVTLSSVSCDPTGDCAAVGSYQASMGTIFGLVVAGAIPSSAAAAGA